jgi:hypothetical protein
MPDRRSAIPFLVCALFFWSTAARGQTGPTAPVAKAHRWVDWQSAAVESRYRVIENSDGRTTTNQLQGRQTARVGFLFDPDHRYSVQVSAGTGNSFTSSWDPLGPGNGTPTWDPSVRQLFVSAAPIAGMTFELGGLGLVRGEETEITSWDNDGFMIGERVTLRRPRQLHLDELSITGGFLGDLTTPNVFRRFDRLDDHNYTQVLAERVLRRVAVSADWTSFGGVATLREAARVTTKAWMPLDAVRVELYQRIEGTRGHGFAVAAERALTAAIAVSGGYSDIDPRNGALNGDRYGIGRRVFAETRIALLPAFSISAFYGAAIGTPFAVPSARRFDVVASWNVLKSLAR